MANQEHIDILEEGVEAWNQWRREHADVKPDLTGVNLYRAGLSEANLSDADLSEAKLVFATLIRANLYKARLYKAILIGADLTEADLSRAILTGADLMTATLSRADLTGAYLLGASLYKANLREVKLSTAHIREADLSTADLYKADLYKADLGEVKLSNAILIGANLREAYLRNAILIGANLSNADLSGANLCAADLTWADLSGANLCNATLIGAILVRTNLRLSTLKDCSIYGISAWDVQLEGAEQLNLTITPENQPTITVDNLKFAQFIYLLLNNQELRDVLNAVTERGVLLLGRFSDGGLEILQSIAAELRKVKYLPMLFDFERPDNRDYTETVKILVGLARFVIVDLSGPSVPQELYATIPHFKIPFVPIVEKRRKIYSMFLDLMEYPWVLKPVVEFENKDHLMELLPSRVIAPAEEKFKERQILLQQLFNR